MARSMTKGPGSFTPKPSAYSAVQSGQGTPGASKPYPQPDGGGAGALQGAFDGRAAKPKPTFRPVAGKPVVKPKPKPKPPLKPMNRPGSQF